MAIATDQGGSGSPFAKFNTVGDTLVGAFASNPRECKRQARDFDSGEPKVKADGKPQWEEVLYFIAMPGTSAQTGNADEGYEVIEPLSEVRWAVQGFKWGQVIDARKGLSPANGFKAGQPCSGDVYTITLVGWSAETKNPAGAEKAGFTVVDGRIVLRSQEEKDAYVLSQSRSGGNTNPAKDYTIEVRRPLPTEKAFEQAADELYLAKPWTKVAAGAPSDASADDDEPF
jgi:hypothetical protein